MEVSRQQLQSQRTSQATRPILEEFIPLKNANNINSSSTENEANISADKANWMTSAQLWNQESEETKPPHSPLVPISPQETDFKLALNGKQIINGGGAFLPFSSKDHRGSSPCHGGEGFPELALASSHRDEIEDKETNFRRESSSGKSGNGSAVGGEKEQQLCGNANNGNQTHRKARRCWSPDLHRRFVNALHMLGGSQGKNSELSNPFFCDLASFKSSSP